MPFRAPGHEDADPLPDVVLEVDHSTDVRAVLRARGIEAALDSKEDRELFGGLSGEALIAAALACTGEVDFRRRVRERLGLPTGHSP